MVEEKAEKQKKFSKRKKGVDKLRLSRYNSRCSDD